MHNLAQIVLPFIWLRLFLSFYSGPTLVRDASLRIRVFLLRALNFWYLYLPSFSLMSFLIGSLFSSENLKENNETLKNR